MNYKIIIKLFLVLFTVLSYLYFPYLLPLIYPGILFFFFNKLKLDFFENVSFSLVFSIAFWITGFWILKLIPISLTTFINITIILSAFITLAFLHKNNIKPHVSKSDVFSFLVALSIFLPIYFPIISKTAPAGADMATHLYNARQIVEKNSFPSTYEPIAPSEHFGDSYIGLPILTAILSLTSNLSILESSKYIIILTYTLIGISIYIFLRQYFLLLPSGLTTLSALWLSNNWSNSDIIRYFYWGGNPTILCIGIFTFTFIFTKKLYETNLYTFGNAVLLATLIYAGFTTHHFSIAAVGYFSIAITIFNIPKIISLFKKTNLSKFCILTFLILLLFSIPFIRLLRLPSNDVLTEIKYQQNTTSDHQNWEGSVADSIYTLPQYYLIRIGLPLLLIGLIGIVIKDPKKKESKIFLIILFASLILIINSKYWILPLSPLLFPDRIITISLIPLLYFVTLTYNLFINKLKLIFNSHNKLSIKNLSTLTATIFICSVLIKQSIDNHNFFANKDEYFVMINKDDINVFNWISKNTSENDVFLNNYGDAGIYIPAVTYRKITWYDFTQYDKESITNGIKKLKPTYLFIGSKVVYPDGIKYTYNEVENKATYREVFSSGNAHLFKIIKI